MFQQFTHGAMEGYLHKNLEGQALRDYLAHKGLEYAIDTIEKDGATKWCQALWPDVEQVKAATIWSSIQKEIKRLRYEQQKEDVVRNLPAEINEDTWQQLVAQLEQHIEQDE